MTNLKEQILEMSRQNTIGELSPWFDEKLNEFIDDTIISNPVFLDMEKIRLIGKSIVSDLTKYSKQTGVDTVILGMSGGVDSALTASLFKEAKWNVFGVTMPIYQNPEETEFGIEACKMLNIKHLHIDLSAAYDNMIATIGEQWAEDTKEVRIRRGNIKARLRMIVLYNFASTKRGLVASTDNYSELASGFWTLHGDCGDLSPIQSLLKSWEVPMLAKLYNVPEKIWRAKPTDGLGVASGDEAQFGMSYLELDLMLMALLRTNDDYRFYDAATATGEVSLAKLSEYLEIEKDARAQDVFGRLTDRMGSTWFKRMNPVNIKHNLDGHRYMSLTSFDTELFQPDVVKE